MANNVIANLFGLGLILIFFASVDLGLKNIGSPFGAGAHAIVSCILLYLLWKNGKKKEAKRRMKLREKIRKERESF